MENRELLDYPYEERKIIKIRENGPDLLKIAESSLPFPYKVMNKMKKSKEHNLLRIAIRQTHSALFPVDGMPQIGKVYICNPIDKRRYYEVHNFHEEMINNKIYEAEYFLRCLGATRIEITNISDLEKKHNGKVAYNSESGSGNIDYSSSKSKAVKWSSTYTPEDNPFIPSNLYWYEHEEQWKMIANARLNGQIDTFELEVEINEDFGINASILIPLKESSTITGNIDFIEFKKSTFRLAGEFKPL